SFRANLQGTLICAWDAAYEKARALWTGSAECWPAAMVRCSDASDLEASLAFAQRYDLLLSIRDGEQPLAKPAVNSGALVIDTSLL
ncbi:MAG: FAD-linked oxidase, partial [Pseudomonadota bacterium]